jgi:hypothetical protein
MRRAGIIVVLAAIGFASRADAQPVDKEACATAYEKAQVERKGHRLVAARAALTYCAQKGCPAIARHDCATWLTEVDAVLPSVVFEIQQDGKLVRDVRVSVDGSVVFEKVEDGAALPLDPGAHVFKFERAGSRTGVQELMIVQGTKNRLVSITLESDTSTPASRTPPASSTSTKSNETRDRAPTTEPTPSGIPVLGLVFGGIAIAGLAGFAGFGFTGVAEENKLRRECAPFCSVENIDYVDRMYLLADISLGVGIVAAGLSTWFFLSRSDK